MRLLFCASATAAALSLVAAAPAPVGAQPPASPALRFCLADPHEASGDGPAAALARLVAARLGGGARVVELGDEDAGAADAVRGGRCDVAVGMLAEPGPMAERPDTAGLTLVQPYYAAAYVLVRRPDAPPIRSLAEVGERRIAVEGESVAAYVLRHRGHRVHVFPDRDGVLAAVADGRAAVGYLWGPHAAPLLRSRADVVIDQTFVPQDRWRFALAMRTDDAAGRTRLDGAVGALLRDGAIERLAAQYHLVCCGVQRQSGRGTR